MKPTTLRRGAFLLQRTLQTHTELAALSGTALALALENLATREGHRLSRLVLNVLSLQPDAIAVAAADLPERILLLSLHAAADDFAKEQEKEKAALSLPLNPSLTPKKKNKEKESGGVADPSTCTHTHERCESSFSENENASENASSDDDSDDDDETPAAARAARKARRTAARKALRESYLSWTPEDFMQTARNCRDASVMDDDTFRAFCLYWLQPDAEGIRAYQTQNRFSMIQRMHAWMLRERRRKYETDQRLERIYGPVPRHIDPPTPDEVVALAREEHLDEADAERFHQYHTAYGWTFKGRPITSWQAALRLWCQNSRKPANPNSHHEPTQTPRTAAAPPSGTFQQRVDDIFNEAIRRTRNDNDNNNINPQNNDDNERK